MDTDLAEPLVVGRESAEWRPCFAPLLAEDPLLAFLSLSSARACGRRGRRARRSGSPGPSAATARAHAQHSLQNEFCRANQRDLSS